MYVINWIEHVCVMYWIIEKKKDLKKDLQCLDIYELYIEKRIPMCRACSFLYKIFLIKGVFC